MSIKVKKTNVDVVVEKAGRFILFTHDEARQLRDELTRVLGDGCERCVCIHGQTVTPSKKRSKP